MYIHSTHIEDMSNDYVAIWKLMFIINVNNLQVLIITWVMIRIVLWNQLHIRNLVNDTITLNDIPRIT